MPNTQVSSLVHCDFSCKGRCQRIASEIQPQLWAFLGGIARNGFQALVVGETVNHAHSFVATRNHAGGESRTTVEGHLFQIDGPKTHRRFSVAGGLRGIYRKPSDRKSTRLNSSHQIISYAVFCLKKKRLNRTVYTISFRLSNRQT